jgi:hypothetical protein
VDSVKHGLEWSVRLELGRFENYRMGMPKVGNRSVARQSFAVALPVTSGNHGYRSPSTTACALATAMLMGAYRISMQQWRLSFRCYELYDDELIMWLRS